MVSSYSCMESRYCPVVDVNVKADDRCIESIRQFTRIMKEIDTSTNQAHDEGHELLSR